MTEAKSPREIAESILADASIVTYRHVSYIDGTSSEEHNKPREMLLAEIESALLSYAAEQRRLLAEADAALDWVVRERREGHWPTGEMLADVRAATDRHRLRSSHPATEGKGDD